MTESLIPDALTPITTRGLYDALRVADSTLTRAGTCVLLSQWAIETEWGKFAHHFNIGNIKHVPGDGHDYCQFRCSEIVGGREVYFDPPSPVTSFRAYASLADGAADYLSLLKRRFSHAWDAVIAGNPVDFAHLLKLSGYYTADEAVYTHGLVACWHEVDETMPRDTAPPLPPSVADLHPAFVPPDASPSDPPPEPA